MLALVEAGLRRAGYPHFQKKHSLDSPSERVDPARLSAYVEIAIGAFALPESADSSFSRLGSSKSTSLDSAV